MKAYNLEKEKSSAVTAFERVLSEHTPCTSISEPDVLVEYLQNLSLKTSMMNEELRRMTHEIATVKKDEVSSSMDDEDVTILKIEKLSLLEKVEDLEKTIKLDAEQLKELLSENKALNSELILEQSVQAEMSQKCDSLQATISQNQQIFDQNQNEWSAKEAKLLRDHAQNSESMFKDIEDLKLKKDDLLSVISTNHDEIRELHNKIEKLELHLTNPHHDDASLPVLTINETAPLSKSQKKRKRKKAAAAAAAAAVSEMAGTTDEEIAGTLSKDSTIQQKNNVFKLLENDNQVLRSQISATQDQVELLQDLDTLRISGSDELNRFADKSFQTEAKISETKNMPEKVLLIRETEKSTEGECHDLIAMNSKLELEVKSLTSSNNELRKNAVKSEIELKRIQSQLARAEASLKVKHNMEKEASEKIVQLEASLTSAENESQQITVLAQQRYEELQALQDEISEFYSIVKLPSNQTGHAWTSRELLDSTVVQINKLQDLEQNMRSEISSLTFIASEREVIISDLNGKLVAATDLQHKTEGRLTTIRQSLQRLENEKRIVGEREFQGKQVIDRLQRELDSYRNSSSMWTAERTKLINELSHSQELVDFHESQKAKHEALSQASQVQTDDLSLRLLNANSRCEKLERELSDTHTNLQERMREVSSMRQLLAGSEGNQLTSLKSVNEKLEILTTERDQLNTEAMQLSKRHIRELDNLKARIADLEQSQEFDEKEKARYRRDLNDLRKSLSLINEQLHDAQQESSDLQLLIGRLKETLTQTEASLKSATKSNSSLQALLEENKNQVEKLSQGQSNLKADIRTLQADKARLLQQLETAAAAGGTPLSSKRSSLSISSSKSSSTLASSTQPLPSASIPYIRNVLLGFLEHKGQRQQLMPVVSTILEFSSNDEKRLWTALS